MRAAIAFTLLVVSGACSASTNSSVPPSPSVTASLAAATTITRPAVSTTPTPTVTITPAASATPALDSCSNEATLRSHGVSATAQLLFSNDSSARRDVFWLDGQGKRVFYKTLQGGESYGQLAHVGDVWVVTDAAGTCAAIHTVVAPALLSMRADRTTVQQLFAIRGRVSDGRSGNPLAGQVVYVWKPDDASCAIVGGSSSPGHVVGSITAPDGTYSVYVSADTYKVRVATTPVNGVTYAPQWWRGKPAGAGSACIAADLIVLSSDTSVDFALQPQ